MKSSYLYLLVCIALVSGAPVVRWATYGFVDLTPNSKSTCAPFQYSICNNISKNGQGYSSALFPNPLAPQYLSSPLVAQSAADATFSLAIATNCSPYITQFLCFAHFPLCTSPTVPPVLPCRSMCERVRCECEAALMSSGTVSRWPDWLNCDDLEKVLTSYGALGVCLDAEANHTCIAAAAAPPTVSGDVVNSSSPDNHTSDVTSFSGDQTSCGSPCVECRVRTNVTGATFGITNANYSFAAKVNVINKYENSINGCNFTLYDVVVLQSFNMCSVPNVPAMPLPFPNATLTIDDNQCADVCVRMVPGQVYWVAGMYGSMKGVPTWSIPRFKGVAALWTAKYDEKWSGWLLEAMNQRGCSK